MHTAHPCQTRIFVAGCSALKSILTVLYQHRPQTVWAEMHRLKSYKPFFLTCVGAQRSLCAPALSVSGPGALCVGARRSLCRAPPLSGCALPALSVSERRGPTPRRFCVGSHQSLAVCVVPQRSLCRSPALSVSCPGAVCVGARQSAYGAGSGRGALSVRLCVGALCVRSGSLCVGPRHSLSRAPAVSVSARRSPAASWPSLCRARDVCRPPALSVSGPVRRSLCGGQLKSACHPCVCRSACHQLHQLPHPSGPAQIHVPPIRSAAQLQSARRRVPLFQEKGIF